MGEGFSVDEDDDLPDVIPQGLPSSYPRRSLLGSGYTQGLPTIEYVTIDLMLTSTAIVEYVYVAHSLPCRPERLYIEEPPTGVLLSYTRKLRPHGSIGIGPLPLTWFGGMGVDGGVGQPLFTSAMEPGQQFIIAFRSDKQVDIRCVMAVKVAR